MSAPSVTVSVVSHGHCKDILLLLDDLAHWAVEDVDKVIITLNVPEEPLARAIQSRVWPFDLVVTSNAAPLGFGANHNQAFVLCRSPFFCIVNPDVRLRCNPYPALLKALQSPGAGCAYPMQSAERGAPRDLAREVPTPLALLRRHLVPGYSEKSQSRDWVNGSFMLFPSPVYAGLKGFDERFFMYCEDVDICLRLRGHGRRLALAADAQVEHRASHASQRQLRHLSWHLASLARLWCLKGFGTYRSQKSIQTTC